MGGKAKAGWRNGVFFFFSLSRLKDCDSEEEENERVNRSDYQGGLMVLTVPI